MGGIVIRVFVCEDNKLECEEITKELKKSILIEDLDFNIEGTFSNPNDLLNYINNNSLERGIYFLDIDLNSKINGIQLATKIREVDPNGFIVFITTHSELSYLTFNYKVEALDYIIKDDYLNLGNRLKDCLLYANKKLQLEGNNKKSFIARVNDRIITVDYEEIILFETTDKLHRIKLYCTNRIVTFYGTMKEVFSKLDDRFIKCHRSYIVNKDHIKEIRLKDRIIVMDNGMECFISIRAIKEVAAQLKM